MHRSVPGGPRPRRRSGPNHFIILRRTRATGETDTERQDRVVRENRRDGPVDHGPAEQEWRALLGLPAAGREGFRDTPGGAEGKRVALCKCLAS